MLKEIEFINYRCFERSKISFKDLSVIVGKNNAGKSTVIEALKILSMIVNKYKTVNYIIPNRSYNISTTDVGIKVSLENSKIDLRSIVNFYKDDEARIIAKFEDGVSIKVYLNREVVFANIYDKYGTLINSRKNAKYLKINKVSVMPPLGLIKEQETLLSGTTVKNSMHTYLSSRHFRNELLLFKEEKYDDFKRLAEETWNGLQIRGLDYDVSQSEYIQLMVQDAGFPAEIGLMGSGIQMWLQIIWFISRLDKNETIILDEPDVYMHPDMQRKILKMVKSTFPQVIIATHSIELISEVDPKYILKIDKMTRNMKYCTDLKAVQNIVDNIGSAQNLSLMRLGDFRKCLFVEGNDIKILSKFYEILYPDNEFSLEMIPWISLGGWSRFNEALGTSKLFYEETSNMIKTICILDHDYHLDTEINELFKKAEESKLILHVWGRKEIENYILVPEVIFKVTGLDKQYYSEFYNELNSKLDIFKVDVVDHYAKQFSETNRGKDPITCNREAREFVENKWNTVEEKFALVNGKEAIKLINRWIKEKYNITCSRNKIISKFTVDDVPNDMKKVIELII